MRRILPVVGVILAASVLTACSSISSGTITSKRYEPGYYYTTEVCTSYGKYGCQMYVPMQEYQPAEYRLNLEQAGKTGWVDVDQSTYDRARVGSLYP